MHRVFLYSTPSCPYCKMARKFLRDRGVLFTEFNVAEDFSARDEMERKSHQLGVPVIEINGKVFVGFDPRSLGIALEEPEN